MKTLIAIPSYTGTIPTDVVLGLFSMKKPIPCSLLFVERTLIDVARNRMISYAIENDFDYILMIDDDTVVESDTLEKLYNADKDIIAGVYPVRGNGKELATFLSIENNKYVRISKFNGDGLTQVLATGTGCMLIKRKVFEDLYKKYMGAPFQFIDELHEDKYLSKGEDIAFCERAREHGYEVWVDTTVRPRHLDHKKVSLQYNNEI